MLKFVDDWLNSITMYRLILYYLLFLVAVGLVHAPLSLVYTTLFLVFVCWIVNRVFARTFGAQTNVESAYITALILALIVTPVNNLHDFVVLGWIAFWAMASKYIVTFNGKHIFNPAAFAVALTALAINQSASWWVGNREMLPFVVIGGLLIVRKMRRFDLVASFMIACLITVSAFNVSQWSGLISSLEELVFSSPFLFFAFVILTEPLTTPPTRTLQMVYGVLVGVLFSPQIHLASFYLSPELAILIGNIFAYLVSPKGRLVLRLKEKIQIAPDIYDFIFVPNRKLAFAPGQYMEWTLNHIHPDSRGNRRYFTLASSPTENNLRVGVKFYPRSSSFKQQMLAMEQDSEIVAAQLSGDFVLPSDMNQKCVFIAGGIGITPFRSMIQYMLDKEERRPITVLYANKMSDEIIYRDVLDRAERDLEIKTVYTLTNVRKINPTWEGERGHIDKQMIEREVPDYRECIFYISGPHGMVTAFQEVLAEMGISRHHIRVDYFPGLA